MFCLSVSTHGSFASEAFAASHAHELPMTCQVVPLPVLLASFTSSTVEPPSTALAAFVSCTSYRRVVPPGWRLPLYGFQVHASVSGDV